MPDRRRPVCWIDSHAHLTMFEPDEVAPVLQRAAAAGVGGVLVPATGAGDLEAAIALADEHPQHIVAAVGVHPHEASSLDAGLKHRVERALGGAGVVAVGEIGLDYHYLRSPREDQLVALAWHLDLAIGAGLPVVLHNRDSWPDLVPLLADREGRLQGVCHSFTGAPDEARWVADLGLKVGISGMVTFKAADNIRAMVAALAPGEVLVETDSPYLAPAPYRGRRNEPGYVVHTGRRVAEEWRCDEASAAAMTTGAFCALFGLAAEWGSRVGSPG